MRFMKKQYNTYVSERIKENMKEGTEWLNEVIREQIIEKKRVQKCRWEIRKSQSRCETDNKSSSGLKKI